MFSGHSGGVFIPNVGGSDALKAVCGDGHSDAGSADQHSKLDLAGLNSACDFGSSVGVIVRLFIIRSDLTDRVALVDSPRCENPA
jgi:hypothetical protein